MPKTSKKPVKKSTRKIESAKAPIKVGLKDRTRNLKVSVSDKTNDYMSRRPHRSFRLTRRRDYARSLSLPGYWSFTLSVGKLLWSYKRLFGSVLIAYAVLNALFVGISSQDAYSQLSSLLRDTGSEVLSGGWGQIGQAGLLLVSGFSGSIAPQLTEVQQVYTVIFMVLTWLTSVWLLRAILAGGRPKFRDAVYNSGAPIVSTMLVLLALIVQLAPLAVAAIVLNVANSTGFIAEGGAVAMLTWLVMVLLALLSIYWATSTFIALIIVTLPGMYPWQAIRTAGDLVVGRRTRILLRLLWMLLIAGGLSSVTLIVAILFDSWLKDILPVLEIVPIVPVVISLIASLTTIWSATYIYLLYRKVVDDDAKPA